MDNQGEPFSRESMMEQITDSVVDGMFAVDREWSVIFFNRSAEVLTGLSRSEALGRKCWDVFRPDNCREVCALRVCMDEDRSISHRIMTIRRGDGSKVQVSVSASPLKDAFGRIVGGVETVRGVDGGSAAPHLREGRARDWSDLGLCTRNPHLLELIDILPRVAATDATVLLLGESGTGKEVFARAIHKLSGRSKGPFVAVNCGALPGELMESELFGYKAGAFTDARRDKPGRFQLAEGGTLLLDEIGEMPLTLQAKILRVLQERSFEPLGGVESLVANVRVVASTNRDLACMVESGSFRTDLYYRLNVVQFTLPPLRERRHDIPLLVENSLDRWRKALGKDIRGVSREVLRQLMRYPYPGNVRELENIFEYACILCPRGLIQMDHLPRTLRRAILSPGEDAPLTMDEVRYRAAVKAVKSNQGNRNAACRDLGISKDTLRKILRLGGTDQKIVRSEAKQQK
jgi:PAS domain S-box-containing protein